MTMFMVLSSRPKSYVLLLYHFFFNDFCQPYYLSLHCMDFHAVSPLGSAMAVDERSVPRFSNFQATLP